MTKYDWINVPKEVQWIATDSGGYTCGYSSKPQRFSSLWHTRNTGDFIAHSFVPSFKGNWRESLEQRPKD